MPPTRLSMWQRSVRDNHRTEIFRNFHISYQALRPLNGLRSSQNKIVTFIELVNVLRIKKNMLFVNRHTNINYVINIGTHVD